MYYVYFIFNYNSERKKFVFCKCNQNFVSFFLAYCNKTFYKKSNLRLHMLIHENIKPYACLYCDRQFTQKATRDVHLTKHTGWFS